jgi:hypothetical protein
MKSKKVISYLILAIYSLLLVHTVIPHSHHVHDFIEIAYEQVLHDHQHEHDAAGNHTDNDTSEHNVPHHSESQHCGDYTFSASTTISQVLAHFTAHYCQSQTIELAPPIREVEVSNVGYIPLKIPIQFSSAVPLRAPPVV